MAKTTGNSQIPVDVPAEQGDGIVHKESNFFAQPQGGRGFGVGIGGESAIGAEKGDRPRVPVPGPEEAAERPSFTNARSGR